MTVSQDVDAPETQEPQSEPSSRGNIAVSLAGQIAQLAEHRRGELAELRRMDPDNPNPPVFWRLLAPYGLLGNPALERNWALILHGIALMAPTGVVDGNGRTAHDGYTPVGKALFLGGESRRESPFYSEMRLNRLLAAQGSMLRTLLVRMFRMLGAAGVSFNWRQMAQFILNDSYDEDAAQESRRRIARDYYQAERRSSHESDD